MPIRPFLGGHKLDPETIRIVSVGLCLFLALLSAPSVTTTVEMRIHDGKGWVSLQSERGLRAAQRMLPVQKQEKPRTIGDGRGDAGSVL
jgi:hypothetical protein